MAALQLSGALQLSRPSVLSIRTASSSVPHTLIRRADEHSHQILVFPAQRKELSSLCLPFLLCGLAAVISGVCVPDTQPLWPREVFLEPGLDICDSSVCLVVAFVLNGTGGEGPVKS